MAIGNTMLCSTLSCFGSDATQFKMHSLTRQTARNLGKQTKNQDRFSKVHTFHATVVSRFTVVFRLLGRLQFVVIRQNLGEAALRCPHRSTWLASFPMQQRPIAALLLFSTWSFLSCPVILLRTTPVAMEI